VIASFYKGGMQHTSPQKTALLLAVLPHVPFDGWTLAALSNAARSCGLTEEMVGVYFPAGVVDAIAYHSQWADEQMLEALLALPLAEMRVPQKIKAAVMIRLQQQAPHREAVRKALSLLSLPVHYGTSARLISTTMDTIWRGIGDRATDYNFYTKRMTLAAVYSATLLFWLNDESPDLSHTEAFLDRRLQTVHRFGKAKQQCNRFLHSLVSFRK
jgi:ubiquinone biosynthesis protein COQ9